MDKEIIILQEILDYQEKIFNFIKREEFFLETSLNEEKLLKLISGLAIISSIWKIYNKIDNNILWYFHENWKRKKWNYSK